MILDLGGHFLLLQGFPDLRIYDLSGSFPRDGKSFFGGWALFGGWLEVITDVDLWMARKGMPKQLHHDRSLGKIVD